MLNRPGIYKITCIPTGKFYIGSAQCVKVRWQLHRQHARHGTHHNRHFQSAWSKHGEDNFRFELLAVCAKLDLIMYEQRFIDKLDPAFNICRTAGNSLGIKCTDAAKAAISAKNKGHRRNIGRKVSDETRALLRVSAQTQFALDGHPRIGKLHSDDAKRKMSVAKKGVPGMRGRIVTEETRKKLSTAALGNKRCLGRKLSESTKNKIAAGKKGKVNTAEHIEKSRV